MAEPVSSEVRLVNRIREAWQLWPAPTLPKQSPPTQAYKRIQGWLQDFTGLSQHRKHATNEEWEYYKFRLQLVAALLEDRRSSSFTKLEKNLKTAIDGEHSAAVALWTSLYQELSQISEQKLFPPITTAQLFQAGSGQLILQPQLTADPETGLLKQAGALYLGGEFTAANEEWKEKAKIRFVVNAAVELEKKIEHREPVRVFHVGLDDAPHQDISVANRVLGSALVEIHRSRLSGQNVLVHCQMGRSRSVSVIISYLMRLLSFTLKKAIRLLEDRNVFLAVNQGFQLQLEREDFRLFGEASFSFTGTRGDRKRTVNKRQREQIQTKIENAEIELEQLQKRIQQLEKYKEHPELLDEDRNDRRKLELALYLARDRQKYLTRLVLPISSVVPVKKEKDQLKEWESATKRAKTRDVIYQLRKALYFSVQ